MVVILAKVDGSGDEIGRGLVDDLGRLVFAAEHDPAGLAVSDLDKVVFFGLERVESGDFACDGPGACCGVGDGEECSSQREGWMRGVSLEWGG